MSVLLLHERKLHSYYNAMKHRWKLYDIFNFVENRDDIMRTIDNVVSGNPYIAQNKATNSNFRSRLVPYTFHLDSSFTLEESALTFTVSTK